MKEPVLRIENLSKAFAQADRQIPVLNECNLDVAEGATVAVVGQSGSGKTTLLSMIAGLEMPDAGKVILRDVEVQKLSEEKLALFRGEHIGIVFQSFHLIPQLTALENVALPLEIAGDRDAFDKAHAALGDVLLQQRVTHFPSQLSGGEAQRVAIARALVTRPSLLLADEPSGNLDMKTGHEVTELLFARIKEEGMTMILVTHNDELARGCQRLLRLQDGKLIQETSL